VQGHVAGRWLLLATLWSLQFVFLRVSVPLFGTAPVAEARALVAALFLLPWAALAVRQRVALVERWRPYLVIGLANNVLPFICFAWAATALPVGYLAIINGLVPLWSALFAAWLLREPLGARRLAGFLLGIAGIGSIVNLGPVALDAQTLAATGVAVLGATLWGWSGVMIKQHSELIEPISLAAGSIAYAAVLMAPLWLAAPPAAAWTPEATAALVALGLLCSGVAYLPFFSLIRDIGPSRTLSVGFVVPLLGVLWGWLFLGEPVTLAMLAGGALVVAAMALVLGG
jgi:drug/metabolite transporter (DMT)-like permease